jgi:indole-3-glycerol phosphate synthase/phosphoribosylanthranilate isomerase
MNAGGILERIVARRRERVRKEGHALGLALPRVRRVPHVPFAPEQGAGGSPVEQGAGRFPFLICELKRRSPSRGDIAPGLDAVAQAGRYAAAGVRRLSVLTEEDHFGGSLRDLLEVKERCPGLAVLRKDFLLDEQDLEVSERAGADAVLLIAALHDGPSLGRLCRRARELGLEVLVELHDPQELARVRTLRPLLTGINSRDLRTFRVDPLAALALREGIDWKTRTVFESGISGREEALVALSAGFEGLLVGEAVLRRPQLVAELEQALGSPLARRGFWARLAARRAARQAQHRPLVKVCGLTRVEDARLAGELGADLLGFVFAPSPRRAAPGLLRELRELPALKVAVVAEERGRPEALDPQVRALLDEGLIDALQLHGEERPERCLECGFPYYKALRIRGPEQVESCRSYRSPRVLADAWAPEARGGTGRRVSEDLLAALAAQGPLWLAGGLGPDNVREAVRRYRPELVDASSLLESAPGLKDRARLERFFAEVAAGGDEG